MTCHSSGFLEKVKAGKAQAAGSGFGGKGLDRLDKERDAKERAERKAYGEPAEEDKAAAEDAAAKVAAGGDDMTFGNFKVEIKRGPAPDSSKLGVGGAIAAAKKLGSLKRLPPSIIQQMTIKGDHESLVEEDERITDEDSSNLNLVLKSSARPVRISITWHVSIRDRTHHDRVT